jgi:hypothetical protein
LQNHKIICPINTPHSGTCVFIGNFFLADILHAEKIPHLNNLSFSFSYIYLLICHNPKCNHKKYNQNDKEKRIY